MKNHSIKELLERQDRREVRKQNATNAVMFIYGLFFLGIIVLVVSIANS